jgi:lipopolysaccharide/colanic/teichoic acid biosynthesis glycosyltransferase
MSFVGPRPLLPEYLELYDAVQKRRHEVRPGITGLAQVHGRNKMLFSEKLKTDVYYVENLSFMLDFKIILQTFRTIFVRYDTVVNAQDLDTVDDLHLTRNLKAFNKRSSDEYKG